MERAVRCENHQQMKTLPVILRRWRRRRGLSQSQAAPVLGVPIKTLQNWEAGRNTPGTLARELIAQKMAAPSSTLHPSTL